MTERRRERHRKFPLLPEVRHFAATGLEVRSAKNTDHIIITGSPIVYDTPYTVTDMFGEFEERMAQGVASDALMRGADVRFLFDHDGLPLARTTSGTMTLTDTTGSLDFEARLDARQQLANDLAIAIERGDVSQMSCGFIVAADEWSEDYTQRQIFRLADLLDVSAVTYPCSPTTSIEVAQRMALAIPVETRARLRRIVGTMNPGEPATREQVAAFRSLVDATLDPGEDAATPDGTGPLGHPVGTGSTWSDPGDGQPGIASTDDGSQGGAGAQSAGSTAGIEDGTGTRSADDPDVEVRADDEPEVEAVPEETSRSNTISMMIARRKRSRPF